MRGGGVVRERLREEEGEMMKCERGGGKGRREGGLEGCMEGREGFRQGLDVFRVQGLGRV